MTDSWEPSYGDVVWVQTHSSLPFWPAYVFDPALLPPETLAMATAALAPRSTIRGPQSRKFALYMYISAHYDFATDSQMRPYTINAKEMADQAS